MVVYSDEGVRGLLIGEIVPDSPAFYAGLKVQDYLLEVDNEDVSRMWYDDAVAIIKDATDIVHFIVSRVVKADQLLKAIKVTVSKRKGDALGAKLFFDATHVSVIDIAAEAVAYRSGLKKMDRIIAIDKVAIVAMTRSEIMQRLSSIVYELTVERLYTITAPVQGGTGAQPTTFG